MKKIFLIAAITVYCLLITDYSFSQGTAINTTGAAADNSAILDVSSTTKGKLMPRMTTAQRNAISSPAEGLQIFNITSKCFEFFANGLWQTVVCSCSSPVSPTATAATGAAATQITANWNVSSGATGYFLDVSTDFNFGSFVSGYNDLSVGNTLTYNVINLTCASTYYYRVRANNSCGTSSSSNTITANTSSCWSCGGSFQVSHQASGGVAPVDKTVTYGTVQTSLSGTSRCWITQNLGATNQASAANDATEDAHGWYWQFNRPQGYKHDGSTRTPNSSWNTTGDGGANWTSGNDPCTLLLGSGWRIPTHTEWTNTIAGWSGNAQTYASVLKIHSAGWLVNSAGILYSAGSEGTYWGTDGYMLDVQTSQCMLFDYSSSSSAAYGFTLRCLN